MQVPHRKSFMARVLIMLISWACLSACGGGGNGNEHEPPPPEDNGPFTLVASYLHHIFAISENRGRSIRIGAAGDHLQFGVSDIAVDPSTGRMFGARGSSIDEFDVVTGWTELFETPADLQIQSLAYDVFTGILYGVTYTLADLAIINTSTGDVTHLLDLTRGVNDIAFDTRTNTLYGINGLGTLVTIDLGTGIVSDVGTIGAGEFGNLEFDSTTNVLYALEFADDPYNQRLYRVDPLSGAGVLVGQLGVELTYGLAHDPINDVLYSNSGPTLYRVDTVTGSATGVGKVGFSTPVGLAYDSAADVVYGVDGSENQNLITIDRHSGEGTFIVSLGPGRDIQGLAFDRIRGLIYATDVANDVLLAVDAATGVASERGAIGFDAVHALAYDPNSEILYGTDLATDQLVSISTATGAGVSVAPIDIPDSLSELELSVEGLAYDAKGDTLYGVLHANSGGVLVEMDTRTGRTIEVGGMSTQDFEAVSSKALTYTGR